MAAGGLFSGSSDSLEEERAAATGLGPLTRKGQSLVVVRPAPSGATPSDRGGFGAVRGSAGSSSSLSELEVVVVSEEVLVDVEDELVELVEDLRFDSVILAGLACSGSGTENNCIA